MTSLAGLPLIMLLGFGGEGRELARPSRAYAANSKLDKAHHP